MPHPELNDFPEIPSLTLFFGDHFKVTGHSCTRPYRLCAGVGVAPYTGKYKISTYPPQFCRALENVDLNFTSVDSVVLYDFISTVQTVHFVKPGRRTIGMVSDDCSVQSSGVQEGGHPSNIDDLVAFHGY